MNEKTNGHPKMEFTVGELRVWGWLADGVSNAGMARRGEVTVRAIEKHINSLYRKLDLNPAPADVNPRVTAARLWDRRIDNTAKVAP